MLAMELTLHFLTYSRADTPTDDVTVLTRCFLVSLRTIFSGYESVIFSVFQSTWAGSQVGSGTATVTELWERISLGNSQKNELKEKRKV